LIKAFLIGHTTYLTGVDANDTLPSNNQGYGMPNMSSAFDHTPRYLIDQAYAFDNSGETWTFDGTVADPSKPVRVVLAYTDQAGAIGTSPQVNDLNLLVDVDGVAYIGNHFSGRWSVTGGTPDSKNNVEAVFLPPATSGSLKVTVTAFNIAGDGVPGAGDSTDQDFALVCYNCAQTTEFTISSSPSSQEVCTASDHQAYYDITLGQILGYDQPVTISASGQPIGSTTSLTKKVVTPPGASTLTIGNLGGALAGDYPIDIRGDSSTGSHTTKAHLKLFDHVPAQPTLLTPSNGETNQPARPTLAWSDTAQAVSYDVQIATDDQFTHIIDSATGLTNTFYVPGVDLDTNTLYFWRVRARNTCGLSGNSAVFSFSTSMAPGDCPVGSVEKTLYSEDFESGADGWTHTGTEDTWKLSSQITHNSSTAFFAEDSFNVSDQQLISPPIKLPSGIGPLSLQFWNYQSIEMQVLGDSCFDGGILEITTDGGSHWKQIDASKLQTDPYDGLVSTTWGNPLAGKNAWCGDPQDWLNSIVDLSGFEGKTVQFRFRLGTDQTLGREGWSIDDLKIQGCKAADVLITPLAQSKMGKPDEVVEYTFNLQNTGSEAMQYDLAISGNKWETVAPSTTGRISPGESEKVAVQVSIPASQVLTSLILGRDNFTLTATSPTGSSAQAVGMTNAAVAPRITLGEDQSTFGKLGSQVQYLFEVTNTGDFPDSFDLLATGNWKTNLSFENTGELKPGDSKQLKLTVHLTSDANNTCFDTTTITAISNLDGTVRDQALATTYGWCYYLPVLEKKSIQ
jgi:hypothetical protein